MNPVMHVQGIPGDCCRLYVKVPFVSYHFVWILNDLHRPSVIGSDLKSCVWKLDLDYPKGLEYHLGYWGLKIRMNTR